MNYEKVVKKMLRNEGFNVSYTEGEDDIFVYVDIVIRRGDNLLFKYTFSHDSYRKVYRYIAFSILSMVLAEKAMNDSDTSNISTTI